MSKKKIDFAQIESNSPNKGIINQTLEQNGKRVRLLELEKGLEHHEWCVQGHIGYVVEGELYIEFQSETVTYSKGDALIIADGEEEKHIPKPISEKVILFLVEDI